MKQYIYLLIFQFAICFSIQTKAQTAAGIENSNDTVVSAQMQTLKENGVSPQETLRMANELYSQGDFRKAVDLYESLTQGSVEADIVYYNLGNAYYKLNRIAPAILNYERALLLNPGDGDIRFNLEMAKLKTVDKIDPIGKFFLTEWTDSLRNVYGSNQWGILGIVSFIILIICLVLFFFSRRLAWKKIGFYMGIAFLVICISSNVFSYQQKMNRENKNTAIVFAPTFTLKSSPNNSGTDIVIIHEGAKVFIKTKSTSWSEVVLENGTVGWIENKMIEII